MLLLGIFTRCRTISSYPVWRRAVSGGGSPRYSTVYWKLAILLFFFENFRYSTVFLRKLAIFNCFEWCWPTLDPLPSRLPIFTEWPSVFILSKYSRVRETYLEYQLTTPSGSLFECSPVLNQDNPLSGVNNEDPSGCRKT